jgi:uncharacterized membrane protein YeaQ/YmgE (transglycosylase-associated protein family)
MTNSAHACQACAVITIGISEAGLDQRGIIGWLVIGLIAGLLGRFLVPGRDQMGCFGTIAVGVLGSFVGGMAASLIFHGDLVLRPSGLLGSVAGAIILLLLLRLVRGRS